MRCRALTTLTELKAAQAEHDVALATEPGPSEMCPYPRQSPQPELHPCEQSPSGRIPSIPKVDEAEKENPPESFDALAARLNARFDRLATSIEPMRERLRAAEEQSEQLRQKLLANRALRG